MAPIQREIPARHGIREDGGAPRAHLVDARDRATPNSGGADYDAIVIGGGQAGLAVAYHLRRKRLRFVVLDAAERVGDAWRNRWDSLRLFTPAKFNGLPGMAFPAPGNDFPTKDEMGDYLEAYVQPFELPVRPGVRVTRLFHRDDAYVVETTGGTFTAAQVVVAMSSYQQPRLPEFAAEVSNDIVQLHSSAYRGPSQLKAGAVLIVGAGNSGAEIARELSQQHRIFMSGPNVGQIPFAVGGFFGRLVLARLVLRVIFHRLLTIRTRLGRKFYPKLTTGSGPLIRVKAKHLAALGVTRVPRTVGVSAGRPRVDDGRVLDVANIVWCTGFHPGFSWIDLPVLDEKGKPRHDGGVVPEAPGLYFVGLHFLYSVSSGMVHGVGRDAERIVEHLAARLGLVAFQSTYGDWEESIH